MPEYKLIYFDCRGIIEAARCCLHYSGIKFEDVHVPYADWIKFKQTYPNGKLPVFYENDHQLTQSGAIIRYVARLTGLAGKDSWEEAKADEIYHYFYDSMKSHNAYVWDKADYKKAANLEEAYAVFLPIATKALEDYTKYLEEAGNGWVLKSGLTYADFVVQSHVQTIKNCDPELVKKFPKVLEHWKKIDQIPQLQSYFSTRKSVN